MTLFLQHGSFGMGNLRTVKIGRFSNYLATRSVQKRCLAMALQVRAAYERAALRHAERAGAQPDVAATLLSRSVLAQYCFSNLYSRRVLELFLEQYYLCR